jgi:serralysin
MTFIYNSSSSLSMATQNPRTSLPDLPYYVSILLWPGDARLNKSEIVGTPKTVTYGFMQSIPKVYNAKDDGTWTDDDLELANFQPLSTAQREAVRQALNLYSDISGLQFVEDLAGGGTIQLGTVDPGEYGPLGWAFPSVSELGDKQGHLWLNNTAEGIDNPLLGTDAFETIAHELGHTLGLKHPFDQSPNPTLPYETRENSYQYTIMAYDQHQDYGDRAPSPKTLMLYDIAAIQYLYGANMQTRTGDNIYQWQTDATFLETIWDAGGTDTISAENQQRSAIINLQAGQFSSIGSNYEGANENVAIAFGVTIENAIGGTGDDQIAGNSVAR